MKAAIYTPDDEEVRFGLPLGRRLREFNYRHIHARFLLPLAFLLSVCFPARALLPPQASLEAAVQFSLSSTALSPSQEHVLAAAVNRIRTEQWCNVRVAVVVGYADTAEGTPLEAQGISEERARRVAGHLVLLGLSPAIVYFEGQGLRNADIPAAGETNALAKVEIAGYPHIPTCRFKAGNNGFQR